MIYFFHFTATIRAATPKSNHPGGGGGLWWRRWPDRSGLDPWQDGRDGGVPHSTTHHFPIPLPHSLLSNFIPPPSPSSSSVVAFPQESRSRRHEPRVVSPPAPKPLRLSNRAAASDSVRRKVRGICPGRGRACADRAAGRSCRRPPIRAPIVGFAASPCSFTRQLSRAGQVLVLVIALSVSVPVPRIADSSPRSPYR
jgi:hypothetical protein